MRAVYEKDHRNKMSREVAARHLGYAGLNGASIGVISALLKYGLLEGRGDEIRVSDAAVAILVDPPGSPDRGAALLRAATSPALFAELYGTYDASIPHSDNLRAHLQKRGFTPAAAGAASDAYRDTMTLVLNDLKGHSTQVHAPTADVIHREEEIPDVPSRASESLKMRISKDCTVTLSFDGPVTLEAIEKLIAKLELSKDEYPEGSGPGVGS